MDKTRDLTARTRAWAELLKRIRHFFDSAGLTEVFTPYLVECGAFEGTLDSLQVRYSTGSGELHTSPEIEMKRLIAETGLSIYQICKCFRDDPPSPIHSREFTMLEFYRVGHGYETVVQDTKDLLNQLTGRALRFETLSIAQAFERYCGFQLADHATVPLLRNVIEKKHLLELSAEETWEDMFFKLMLERVEPNLPAEVPVILVDYPTRVSPLSQGRADGFAERFEIYWHGMELCNGCTELRDRAELERRFAKQNEDRAHEGKPPHPFPSTLFDAVTKLPPCAGVALGVDRLSLCLEKEGG